MGSGLSTSSPTGRFELRQAITISRGLMKGTKRHIVLLALLFGAVDAIAGFLWGPDSSAGEPASFWFHLAIGVTSGVAALAYATVGLLAAAGEKVTFGRAFRYMYRLPAVLIVMLPVSLGFAYLQSNYGLGWSMVLSIAGVPMAFWILFLVDRDMNPFEAIASSVTFVLDNLASYVAFALLGLALAAVVGITLGVAAIWVLPFMTIAPGVMFAMAQGLHGDYSE